MLDVFGTAATRDRVLAAWAASPARFREDANAEEDFALGGYRDRLVVELAQNAADAAARADRPGRLRLTLRDDHRHDDGSTGPVLVAANTGAPLTAEGVESLATLRASAKRDDKAGETVDAAASGGTVGRFGVGFAAVLAVTDEPAVLSRTGGVRFSRDDTATLVSERAESAPGLAAEVRRRSGHVPVLRLPFESGGEPPEGFDTAVVLPLRDEAAADLVRRLLAEADDALLLALPHLDRIEIDTDPAESPRVLADVDERWHVHRAAGRWTADERRDLLADRPTEERANTSWSVLWALPRTTVGTDTAVSADVFAQAAALRAAVAAPAHAHAGVVHAPTPTDEPLSLPALLLASFPLDPSRRHVAPGPLTERLVEEAAAAYAEFVRSRAEVGDDVTPLVPVGLPTGRLDGMLRDAALRLLPETPLLRAADGDDVLRPRDAVVIDDVDDAGEALVRILAAVVDGLVEFRRSDRSAFEALRVRRMSLADLVDELAGVAGARPPDWCQRLYVALAPLMADPATRESLAGLPVPLADGRIVRGPRGLLVPDGDDVGVGRSPATVGVPAAGVEVGVEAGVEVAATSGWEALASYGLRLIDPRACAGAAAEVLERLGAVRAGPRVLLEDSAVRAAVEESFDCDDPGAVADGVLGLVAAAVAGNEVGPGDLPWLADLTLLDSDGELAPAGELVLPRSPAEAILDPEEFAPVAADLVERWGEEVLAAVGVVRTFGILEASDVDLTTLPDTLADIDDIDAWASDALGVLSARWAARAGWAEAVLVVRDLDAVRTDGWPTALRLLARDRSCRRALVEPVRLRDVERTDGPVVEVPSYAAWWLRRHVRVDGQALTGFADPDAEPAVAGLLAPPPDWLASLDPSARAALGVVRSLDDLDSAGVGAILLRLGDPALRVSAATMLALWDQLGRVDPAGVTGDAPPEVRVIDGADTRVVDARSAVVVESPMWQQRTDLGGQVLASGADSTAEVLAELLDIPLASEVGSGTLDDEGEPRRVPGIVRDLVPELPSTWWEHDDLTVDGHPVDWWVESVGGVGADGGGDVEGVREERRPHASTSDGLARALAWAAGRWESRHLIAAVLAEPDRAPELLLEHAYDRDGRE